MDIPILYRPMNLAQSTRSPQGVRLLDNETTAFYSRYLMKRAISGLVFEIPDEWDENYFQYTLFGWGFGAVLDLPRYGISFQGGNLFGRNLYYQPTRFITANPLIRTPSNGWKVHEEAVVLKLQPDYTGLFDVVTAFAQRLALAYEAWQMNTQNSKLAYVLGVDNKAQKATFDRLFDKIQSGQPAAVTGTNLIDKKTGKPLWFSFSNDLRANYIAPDITEDMRAVMNEFDSFVGIPANSNAQKRERQIVDEVNANNVETDTILDLIVRTLGRDMAEANRKFGLNLSVKKRYPLLNGGERGAEGGRDGAAV